MAKKRLISMLALLAILVGFFNPVHVHAAESEGFGYITTTGRTLPVRKDPSSKSAVIAYLNNGTGVSITKQTTNSEGRWYEIRYTTNVVGYVHENNIRLNGTNTAGSQNVSTGNTASQSTFGYITTTDRTLPVRKDPSSKSAVIAYLNNGTGVSITKQTTNSEGRWYEIRYTTKVVGYVHENNIRVIRSNATGSQNVSTGNTASQSTFGYIKTTDRTLPVRKDPSSKSAAVAYLKNGTGVSITGQTTNSQGKWYKIRYTPKVVGYVHESNIRLNGTSATDSQNVSTGNTASQSTFGYIKTTDRSLPVKKDPSSKSAAVAYLKNGTGVSITGQTTNSQGKWYKVRYTPKVVGYVHENNIQLNSTQNKGNSSSPEAIKSQKDGIVQVSTKLMVRSKPSTSSYDVLEYLYNGNSVTILETSSDRKWKKVETESGKIGWCAASYVKEGKWVLVSTGKTTSTTSSTNSRYNASLACSRLTGIVISPNKTFSWVKIMGSCSKDKGFKESTVFQNGKRVKGYGGGVCQVSTTINIAAKNAGIKTNATKHSLPVSYAERKDEATVAYPYVDFSFKNTLNVPLKLVLTANNGSCTCKVYKFEFER